MKKIKKNKKLQIMEKVNIKNNKLFNFIKEHYLLFCIICALSIMAGFMVSIYINLDSLPITGSLGIVGYFSLMYVIERHSENDFKIDESYNKNKQEPSNLDTKESIETKEFIETKESIENAKESIENYLKSIGNREIRMFLEKDDAIEQIIMEINAYCDIYNMPEPKITDSQWNTYFDTMYRVFKAKGIENKFYISMSELCKKTFDEKLKGKDNIKIKDFIDSFEYLTDGFCSIDREVISEQEMLIINQEIKEQLESLKIVNFNAYVKKMGR